MNNLVLDSETPVTRDNESTDALLAVASTFGECHLHRIGKGWSFTIDMNTVVEGGEFRVRSEYGIGTARAAIIQCLDRARAAVKS